MNTVCAHSRTLVCSALPTLILLVGALLPNHYEAQTLKQRRDLAA
jgi:hypothetical protein